MQIVVVFLVILAGSCGRLAAGLKAGVCWRCVCWRGLAADLECGRDSRTTKTPPFVRLKRDQKQGRNTGRNERWEAGDSGGWPDPVINPRFCSALAALVFVRFLEYAEQNRLKTRGFCAAGSVRIMWGVLYTFSGI